MNGLLWFIPLFLNQLWLTSENILGMVYGKQHWDPINLRIWEAMIEQANEYSEMECFQNGNVSSELVYKK